MRYGNNLKRKTIGQAKDSQTEIDYQNSDDDTNVFGNLVVASLIAFGGYKLYRSGALKDLVKPFLELGDKIASTGGDKAFNAMYSIKKWQNMNIYQGVSDFTRSSQRYIVPSKSIFRKDAKVGSKLVEDIKTSIKRKELRFNEMKEVISDSAQDISLLNRIIEEGTDYAEKAHYQYRDTDLLHTIKEIQNYMKTVDVYSPRQQSVLRDITMQEFVNKFSLSKEEAQQQLKLQGYRKAVLGDILDVKDGKLTLKANSPIKLNDSLHTFDTIEEFMQKMRYTTTTSNGLNGTTLISDWEHAKNIILDSSIRIDEKGHIIDYRMSKNAINETKRSLARDFKLPVVQFNPIQSLTNWANAGERKPFVGMLASTQIDPGLTGRAGEFTIGEVLSEKLGKEFANAPVSVINGKAFVANMKDNEFELLKIREGLKLNRVTNAGKFGSINSILNAQRQMAGLTLGEVHKYTDEEFAKLSNFQKVKYRFGQKFDFGWQERVISNDKAEFVYDKSLNIDEWTDALINKVTWKKPFRTNAFDVDDIDMRFDDETIRNFRTVWGQGFEKAEYKGSDYIPDMFVTTRKSFKVKDILKDNPDEKELMQRTRNWIRQFFAGQGKDGMMDEAFTESSANLYKAIDSLTQNIGGSSYLLGLSINSKKSSFEIGKNLFLKRVAPIYFATKIPGIVNALSEPFMGEDEDGNPNNLGKFITSDIIKPLDLGMHYVKDFLHITNVSKFVDKYVPGADQINELPGIYQLGMSQTYEERKEYIENGYDPVRKGRYWSAGNTPFTGGKIMYFRPNFYRRVEADVKFSDSQWGSRQEYYNNTWFPNPMNPLAPLNHFVLDRNHYDKKHYYDRPYLQTAPVGSNIPMIGPLFSSTVGSILPQKKMHKEYWQKGFAINPADEQPNSLLTDGEWNPEKDKQTFEEAKIKMDIGTATDMKNMSKSSEHAISFTKRKIKDNAGITFIEKSILPEHRFDKFGTSLETYTTPSGAIKIVDVPDDLNIYNVNQSLQKYSLNKVVGTNQRVSMQNVATPGVAIGNDDKDIDNAFMYGLGQQYNLLTDIFGMKGFEARTFVFGEANQDARMIENSSYAYSANRGFWDENFGGLGGGISEISRRFINRRNKNTEYINPIRNTMPVWMPGSNYFTDFKHGDPYSKIEHGEERLPGEGYERLNNIKDIGDLRIGSSFIGKGKNEIVRHLLNQDGIKDAFSYETVNKGTDFHKEIERAWRDSGVAISIEGKIQDKRNGILGYYDAMVLDHTSKTGTAIVDIKTTSAKKLDELRKNKKALEHHQRQVNYYLWATGNTKANGYIYYVDKENKKNSYTIGFKFDKAMLKSTLKDLQDARAEVRKGLEEGKIGRGELYSDIDKFRILADVAPYSQEYTDMASKLSFQDLSDKDKQEVSAIKDRVKAQKEPLRVYPYKFKTSNLKSEKVTVSRIIDNNTIVTKEYGKEHAIKFAGVNVSMSNTDNYKNTSMTMNDAARKELKRYIKKGSRITISYDADERNKYSKDSTRSIRAVITSRGTNVNRVLIKKGLGSEKEEDDSPASIRARYTKGEIAFGSAMERSTHLLRNIPIIGNKFLQVASPYEQYRKREVYSKDFQSWEHPIRDILRPAIDESIGNKGIGGIMLGTFVGSMFGRTPFGKMVGATVGAGIPIIGKAYVSINKDQNRDWVPKRRREQEKMNEYVDMLKYIKNQKLYMEYKEKAKAEDNFDVDAFMGSKKSKGITNKLRQQELDDYKRKVKLDFKHRGNYNFKYGKPLYVKNKMNKKETISAINKEKSELQSERKVTNIPNNAIKAIGYYQQAKQTMYGYEAGDPVQNIMTALPKKDRQYFKYFVKAPEEEKQKILRIAPSYLRRALQSSWGMKVDEKPTLIQYFSKHALPNADWVGWNEETDLNDVKVKLIHRNKLDFGEFDIWDEQIDKANETNIPIPKIDSKTNTRIAQVRLQNLLGKQGFEDVNIIATNSPFGNRTVFNVNRDPREEISEQIKNMQFN